MCTAVGCAMLSFSGPLGRCMGRVDLGERVPTMRDDWHGPSCGECVLGARWPCHRNTTGATRPMVPPGKRTSTRGIRRRSGRRDRVPPRRALFGPIASSEISDSGLALLGERPLTRVRTGERAKEARAMRTVSGEGAAQWPVRSPGDDAAESERSKPVTGPSRAEGQG